jgi:hypothetical protein
MTNDQWQMTNDRGTMPLRSRIALVIGELVICHCLAVGSLVIEP